MVEMKALVFDLDDTLLNSAKEIGPRTRRAMDAWLAGGREIVIATSRPIRKVRAFLPEDYFLRCEIVTMNGAARHFAGGQIHKAPGLGDAGKAIAVQFPYGHSVQVTAEIDGEEFATNYHSTDEELMQWNAATRDMVLEMERIDFERMSKIALSRWGPHMDDLMPWLNSLGCEVIVCEGGTFINVVASGVDKSTALMDLFSDRGWGRGDVAVFGDDLPDIKMMTLTDHAVAMANASDEVKAVAHHVIGHCNDDCIGPYIEQWL